MDEIQVIKLNKLEEKLDLASLPPVESFLREPSAERFKKVPKSLQTEALALFAVQNDGRSLKYVSKKLLTEAICQAAVEQKGVAIWHVPEQFVNQEMYMTAVADNGSLLRAVPQDKITMEMCKIAVRNSREALKYVPAQMLSDSLIKIAISTYPTSIEHVPYSMLNREYINLSVALNGLALEYVPKNRINKELIFTAVKNNPCSLEFVPKGKRTEELSKLAYELDHSTLEWIPDKYISTSMCVEYLSDTIEKGEWVNFDCIPYEIIKTEEFIKKIISYGMGDKLLKWHQKTLDKKNLDQDEEMARVIKPLPSRSVNYLKTHLIENSSNGNILVENDQVLFSSVKAFDDSKQESLQLVPERGKLHRLVKRESLVETDLYYISDIHVEHQMQNLASDGICKSSDLHSALSKRLSKMIRIKENYKDILLIAGDVSSSPEVEEIFYEELSRKWDGSIVAILGNHELWDGKNEWNGGKTNSRSVDEIVNDYRSRIERHDYTRNVVLLENSLFIRYKNQKDSVISEQDILESSEADLKEICHKSTVIILGGIGYSGLNDSFNAEHGIYRNTIVSRDIDRKMTSRFNAIYDKISKCAADEKVIVLTHNPVSDWTTNECNPNWIYINGHTHRNYLIRNEKNGITVLADNQIGYKPRKWKLNHFILSGGYDPFADYSDGIYPITSEQFADFNNGRGIVSEGCHYRGQILVLKRNGYYLFLIDSPSSLCILNGGHRKRLNNVNVEYYYNNMDKYIDNLYSIFKDYYSFLQLISKEIKTFGGKGTIHGSIVDIDFLNHIYVNPYDGKVTAYFAYDVMSREVYSNLGDLIEEHIPELKSRYYKAITNNRLPMLTSSIWSDNSSLNISEDSMEYMFGTEIYDASRKLRAIQYFFDNNVIRVWEDNVLNYVAPKPKHHNKQLEK